jgi:catechol 2,3-dioxygenase-like lactoylglutathione lyase family enzyme
MLDHLTLHVRDVDASVNFYMSALAPLGYLEKVRHGDTVGLGVDDGTPRADFYIAPADPTIPTVTITDSTHAGQSTDFPSAPISPITHLAFRAQTPQAVSDFYEAALSAGGKDNGKPGLREYHPGYFAAFVLDPDGNNIEAVTDWSHCKNS